jgi:hypothetical protein
MERVPSTFSSINVCTACNNCTENEALSSLTLIHFDEGMQGKWTCEAVNAVRSTLSPHDTDLRMKTRPEYRSH